MYRLRNLIVVSALVLAIQISAQPEWVDFMGRTEESPPAAALLQSDKNTVSFTIQVNGMLQHEVHYQDQIYQRLSMPDCDRTVEELLPEVPVVTQLVAVPDCDDVILSVMPSGELEFQGYHVCPAPKYVRKEQPDGTYIVEEVFEENVSAYNTNNFYPQIFGEIIETGYVREQKVVHVALYPVWFNPVRNELKVFTDFHVSLTFVNPVSPVNKELGIFRNMMNHAAINYELKGISASKIESGAVNENASFKTTAVTAGSVNRVTNLDLLVGPSAMPVDYLIITHADLFNSSYLTQLANHRRDYNGFDVVIVQVDAEGANNDIYDFYSGDENYISIRDCIDSVYTNGKANHTYDGRLGYFVLVGDAYKDDNSTEMVPASYAYQDYPIYDTLGVLIEYRDHASDYYYACTGGDSDDIMDLMYGRLSVGTTTELNNIVNKIIDYELNSSAIWNDEVTFISGCFSWFYYCDSKFEDMTEMLPPPNTKKHYAYMAVTGQSTDVTEASPIFGQTFTSAQYTDSTSANCGATALDNWIYDNAYAGINNNIHTFVYEGHGRQGALRANEGIGRVVFRADSVQTKLSNSLYPFMIFNCCGTGHFDATEADLGNVDCIGEVVVNLADEGAIGCLASARTSDTGAFGVVDEYVLEAEFEDMSHIMGEAVMESKLNMSELYKRQYNLYGDPALNLFPYDFTVTEDITWSDTVDISDDITIDSGVTLTIDPGTHVVFHGYYNIDIESGANIIAEGTEADPIVFTSATGTSPGSWNKIQLEGSDNSFIWCQFEYGNYPLYFYGYPNLITDNVIENCTFTENSYGPRFTKSEVYVKNCSMIDNSYNGVQLYNCSDLRFTGNTISDNNCGVYSGYNNFIEFYGNLIEDNSYLGVHAQSSDVVQIGYPYHWNGYNIIRDNGTYGVRASGGDPDVDMHGSSVYNSTSCEIYNNSGNPQIYALACWFGGSLYSCGGGYVYNSQECGSEPWWEDEGEVPRDDDGGLPKAIANLAGGTIPPQYRGQEGAEELKNIIQSKPASAEGVDALADLYGMLRADYHNDKYGERTNFYPFLKGLSQNKINAQTGKRAFRYMILWKMLENDNVEVIRLSEEALDILEGEDRMSVLEGLTFTYAYTGQTEKARACLSECQQRYDFDNEILRILEEEIAEAEKRAGKGIEHPEGFDSVQEDFTLLQNYPNPGNPRTTIRYELPEARPVEITIYNALGQQIYMLVDEFQDAGVHEVVWDGKDSHGIPVSSGIYIYRFEAGEYRCTKKLTLLK